MAKHKESEHKEHKEGSKNIIVIAVIVIALIILIAVLAIVMNKNKTPPDTRPLCSSVQGSCRLTCASNEVTYSNAQCAGSSVCCVVVQQQPPVQPPIQPPVQPPTYSCNDTDGNDANTAGYVQDSTGLKHYDTCQDANTVTEFTCDANGNAKPTNYDCPYQCKDGKCIPEAARACTDSDGNDIYTKGYVSDITKTTFWDYCQNSQTVEEYTCNNYDYAVFSPHFCPSKVCVDGACAR